MVWILSILFLLPAMAAELPWAGVQADAYNLHQALNYLNVYTSGQCEAALDLAKKHLGQIRQKPGDQPFGEIAEAVRKFPQPTTKDITDLELLRMKYGDALTANHIEHQKVWHQEVLAVCPTAPRID